MGTPAQRLENERWKYPGMAPREVIIWRAWLALHQQQYTGWAYNVLVGSGTDPGPAFPQVYRDQYIRNTQKRMDAIAYQGAQPFIFEIKDRATASSMSQLLVYRSLWKITFPNTPPPQLVLITNRTTPDIAIAVADTSIRLDVVPNVDFSPLQTPRLPGAPPPKG